MKQLFKSYSDHEIILRIKKGGMEEDRAIAYLLKTNEKSVYSFVLKNSGNRDAASTLLVEGVTELILNIRSDKFEGQSSISTYLYSICRSLWLRKLKQDKRSVELSDQKMNNLADEPSNPIDLDKLRFDLNDLLKNIGEQCKTVLEMWSVHYSMSEIAESMRYKNAQIAMNKKNRCLTQLKAMVSTNPALRERLKNYLS